MNWLRNLIYGYTSGLMLFYTFAVFDTRYWDALYYIWSNIFDAGVVTWGVIYFLVTDKRYKFSVKLLWLFSCVRIGWELISDFFNQPINDPVIVAVLFLIMLGVITYLSIKRVRN